MREFPALPLFMDAYLADTRHLTAAQHGAYLLLLMMAWRLPDCALPNDDKLLARWAAMDQRTWQRNKAEVMAFWHLGEDQKFRQNRRSSERHYVSDVSCKKSAAGLVSALKRKNRRSTYVPTERQQNGNTHTHTHTHTQNSIISSVPDDICLNEAKKPEKSRQRKKITYSPEFDAFWEYYTPNGARKSKSAKAYERAINQ